LSTASPTKRTAKKAAQPQHLLFKDQAAKILVAATHEFLRSNGISEETIKTYGSPDLDSSTYRADLRLYRKLTSAYEYMGVLIATWFSNPKFLDARGEPLPLTIANGPLSLTALMRASRVPFGKRVALQLMKYSPSVKFGDGTVSVLSRVFVLPDFEVPRAALVVERFLDTLHKNFSPTNVNVTLLERSCQVTGIDLRDSAPILRDIKERGAALVDAIDGEIEARRFSRRKGNPGELGVLVFAWARPST
jgi:hypothetical protein